MMCKDQSKKWARWKIVLFVPLAASVLYAFSSPDVNRQLTLLIPSEDTINSPEAEKYSPEFFRVEATKFLKMADINPDISQKDILEQLEQKAHKSILLVNALDDLLYEGRFIDWGGLQSSITKTLLKDYRDGRPVAILLQYDRETSNSAVNRIYKILGDVFENNKEALANKKQPIVVFDIMPVHYGMLSSSEAPVLVTLLSGEEILGIVEINDGDTEKEIRRKIRKVGRYKSGPLSMHIEAPENIPMGKITDLKEIFRTEASVIVKATYALLSK